MLKKLGRMMLVVLTMIVLAAGEAAAGEIDLLVQKLVDKGILSAGEAQELVTETHEQIKKQNAMGTNDLLPAWVQNTKLKGDVRIRYEGIKAKSAKYLNHERLRVRLGVETKVNDQMKVGIGIATGKPSDARSRNVSLGADNTTGTAGDPNSASPKNIVLDYAYAEYTPLQYATIVAGKFQNPIWSPWDMIWKGDITPEGAALKLNYPVSSSLQLFMNNMVFILRQSDKTGTTTSASSNNKQPDLVALQSGLNWNVTENTSIKAATTVYMFSGLQGRGPISYSLGNNSGINISGSTPTGSYIYNYNAVSPSVELGVKNPFGDLLPIPYAAIFGDYIYNVSGKHPKTGRGGFDTGVKFGYEKVADKGQWQMKLATSKIGRDAWVDAFTDSDRYRKGMTNTQSYEGILEYGLGKNTSLCLDYYYSFLLDKNPAAHPNTGTPNLTTISGSVPEQLVQLDWNLKF